MAKQAGHRRRSQSNTEHIASKSVAIRAFSL
jgi:hypothetical protein